MLFKYCNLPYANVLATPTSTAENDKIGIESITTKLMGEAKRRKEALGNKYGQEETVYPWLPITKSQADTLYKVTTKGAWIGIGLMIAIWVTVRFIGPAFGWWQVQ